VLADVENLLAHRRNFSKLSISNRGNRRGIIARPTSSPDKENGWRQWLGYDTGGLCTLITQFYWC
jgi:hypothetical protein